MANVNSLRVNSLPRGHIYSQYRMICTIVLRWIMAFLGFGIPDPPKVWAVAMPNSSVYGVIV